MTARPPVLLAVDGLEIGGTERQMVALVKGLRHSDRHRVVLAVLDRGGALESEACEYAAAVLPIRRRARFDVTPAAALLWHARRADIRLVHAVGRLSGLALLPVARRLRVPIVNGSIRSAPASLSRRDRLTRWCARRSDWIVANSRVGLMAHGLDGHPRAQVIANGIDLPRVTPGTTEGGDGATICMVANFNRRKDHATLLRALSVVRRAMPAARLILVGGDFGTLDDHRRLAQHLGVADAVRFVTDTDRPAALIAASQVCVLTSSSESFSNAILEYMALAKPVVASDTCGDSAALLRDGSCGLLVPHGDAAALAARLTDLLRDPLRARTMGEAARRRVQDFSVARMAAEYDALFDRLLAARGRG